MTDNLLEPYKRAYLNTMRLTPLLRLISEALGIKSIELGDILNEICRLRENQREEK
jgi:hypothetical protein